jgi:hypothetical protein
VVLAEPVEITQRVTRVLEDLEIRYFVGGSLASSLHGIPRATQDVDIVAEIESEHIPLLVGALESDFYIDAEMIRNAVSSQASFNVIHLATMFKVDVFVLKPDAASQEEMARRERFQISDAPPQGLFLATAEDVVLHKLYWYKLGGGISDRQWRDVLGVLQVQHDRLDRAYLAMGAERRQITDLLERAWQDAQIDD